MRHSRTLVFLSLILAVAPLFAASRTFVSATGNDANLCSRDLPCRTFAAAMAQTAANGEVVVIDSAGYGPLTITRSVSLIAPDGVHAGITATGGAAITINAGTADKVTLRNLSITNGQSATTGVAITAAGTVYIDHCLISGFFNDGVNTAYSSTTPSLVITDTAVRDNAQAGVSTSTIHLTMTRCHLSHNATGLYVPAGLASITNTIADFNSWAGMTFGETAMATLHDVVATQNDHGFWIDGGEIVMTGGGATANTHNGFFLVHIGARPATSELVAQNVQIAQNHTGIFLGAASDATITDGLVSRNAYGIDLSNSGALLRLTRTSVTKNVSYGLFCEVQGLPVLSNGENLVNGNGSTFLSDNVGCTVTALPKL